MAIQPEQKILREVVTDIRIYIYDLDGATNNPYIEAEISFENSTGAPAERWRNSLKQHLTAQQLTSIENFISWVRSEAESRLLE